MAFATLHSNLELSVVAPQHIHILTTKMNVRELGGLHVEGCKLERNPQINRVFLLLPKLFDDFQATSHNTLILYLSLHLVVLPKNWKQDNYLSQGGFWFDHSIGSKDSIFLTLTHQFEKSYQSQHHQGWKLP